MSLLSCPFIQFLRKSKMSYSADDLLRVATNCPVMRVHCSTQSLASQEVKNLANSAELLKVSETESRYDLIRDVDSLKKNTLYNSVGELKKNIFSDSSVGVESQSKYSSSSNILNIPVRNYSVKQQLNTTNNNFFNFDEFCASKIQEKIESNSYRIFKRICRLADEFPYAKAHKIKNNPNDMVDFDKILVWCSNDYLGLSRHPSVLETAKRTISECGVGSGGTRNISGNQILHEKLEQLLAIWYRKPAGLLFTSCYVANCTTFQTLGKIIPNLVYISDAGNHASMIEGMKNSRSRKIIYRHNDPDHLESILKELDPSLPKIVAFESLNSMNGSIAPIKKLCQISHKYGAITFIDEVHAVGLYGKYGSGQGELQECLDEMDIISGTLGKAVGSMGGFIVGGSHMVDFIRSYGSGLIFTTSLSPVLIASAIKSIEILMSLEGQHLRDKHQSVSSNLRIELTRNGFPIFHSLSHILPIHVGDAGICRNISDELLNTKKMYIQAINYPTVKVGTERLRIAPTPFHTNKHVEQLLDGLKFCWDKHDAELLHKQCHIKSCNCISRCREYSFSQIPNYVV